MSRFKLTPRKWYVTSQDAIPILVWVRGRYYDIDGIADMQGFPTIRLRGDYYWTAGIDNQDEPVLEFRGEEPPFEWTL